MNPIIVRQMYQSFKALSNPQAYVNQALQNNPQLKQIMQDCGNNPEQAFYALAKQKGVSPDSILNMLK